MVKKQHKIICRSKTFWLQKYVFRLYYLMSVVLIQTQEISLHTPHPRLWRDFQPNPLLQGERGLHRFPPPLMGGGEG
jgi:hypothetical protein